MYIEELIIEGFKSYATRTVIKGWDPSFTAITGLNGSGKSNILDALCFVLGIDNLKQIRANSLQDLVYKRGQAGINKATVTIVFNNADKRQSPVGYQDCKQLVICRQVVLGGKNKYMINGVNAPQQTVENLFGSVQLSVNHPHFLIMQGRVTKLLGMKPVEIGAMLEETAGTRMYEEHKERALVTIEKKARKVAEIEDALANSIGPRLEKLRDERHQWQQWQVLQHEVRDLEQVVLVQSYWAARTEQDALNEKLQQDEAQMATLKAQIAEKEGEGRQLAAHAAKIKAEQGDHSSLQEKQLAQRLQDAQKEVAQLEARMGTLAKAQQDTKMRLSELATQLERDSKVRNQNNPSKPQDFEVLKRLYETEKATFETDRDALKRLEEVLTGLTTGLTTDKKATGQLGYDKLIADENARLLELQGELERGRMRAASLDASLEAAAPTLMHLEKQVKAKQNALESAQMQVEVLRKRLLERVKDGGETMLQKERTDVANQLAALPSVSAPFTFAQPSDTSFDSSKVYGRVGELVHVRDTKWNLALEVAAGSRLQNVVVASEREASILLEQGQLKVRTTFLPLSKMHGAASIIPATTMARILAHPQHGKDAQSALDAISFENDALLPAMQFVFGNMLLCLTKVAASFFAYDAAFRVRCVTIDGDLYDPAGTLTGGGSTSKDSSGGILSKMQHTQERQILMARLNQLDSQLKTLSEARAKQGELERQLDFAMHAVKLQEATLKEDPQVRQLEEYRAREQELAKWRDTDAQLKANASICEENLARWRADKTALSQNRKKGLGDLEETIAKKRLDIKVKQARLSDLKKQLAMQEAVHHQSALKQEEVLLERDSLTKELVSLEMQQQEARSQLDAAQYSLKTVIAQLDTLKAASATRDAQLEEVLSALEVLRRATDTLTHEQSILQRHVTKQKAAANDLAHQLDVYLKQGNTIYTDNSFPPPPPPRTLNTSQLAAYRSELAHKQAQLSSLSGINTHVMDMMASVERKQQHLLNHLAIIRQDKEKIASTVRKLNTFKRDALEKTFNQVNKDFGDLFGELLPGGFATLVPAADKSKEVKENRKGQPKEKVAGITVNGEDDMDSFGVEEKHPLSELAIQVRLGNVWKASLSELSGGQRSLIALALLFSLLLTRPAPLYLLDEIDAALDLAHTQTIGSLVSSPRFKGSQFIIISLKDGLFQNAPVLFRTVFKDGISVIQTFSHGKLVQNTKSKKQQVQEQQEEDNKSKVKKKVPKPI